MTGCGVKSGMGSIWFRRQFGRSIWRKAIRGAVAAAALAIGLPRLSACECRPTPPACQAYGESPLIFLGTVAQEIPSADAGVIRYRMTVDHSFKGVTENEVML